MNAQLALKTYGTVQVESGVQDASSHRLIEMLFDGLLTRLAQAKGAMKQKDIELRCKKINEASSIVIGLRDSLDLKSGGDMAANLDSLYEYVLSLLIKANRQNDPELINECGKLISQISGAWRQITPE